MKRMKVKRSKVFPGLVFSKASTVRFFLMLTIVALNVSCDQVSKQWVREKVSYYERIALWGDQMVLTKVENTGAFLSLGADLEDTWRTFLLLWLPAIAMLMVLMVVGRQKEIRAGILLGTYCMVGGGIGNLIDRWRFSSVTDFLHIDLGFVQTGIFNFADVSIMVGALCVMWFSLAKAKTAKNSPEAALADIDAAKDLSDQEKDPS